MKKSKKLLSLLIAILMVLSTVTVFATAVGADDPEDTKLYFDASSTGWTLGSKDKIGFYVFSTAHGEEIAWGGKKLNGTDEGNGIWSYDPAAKGMNIIPGEQYKIIFTGAGNQTYDLIFDTTCYGHVAYCDDTIYENPVDSSKQTRAAFWKDMDATKYGPVLQISSIGNVVGTCPEEGKTPETVFEDFLNNNLDNARTYMVEPGKKTEQELIDDIGEGLGITKDAVQAAFISTGVTTVWNYDDSALPREYERAIDTMQKVDDITAGKDTFTVYFQMPTGDNGLSDEGVKVPDWYNEYNKLDGQGYAGIYWWQGAQSLDPWPGALMTLENADDSIFSAKVPDEPDVLTEIIFNNAVNGGTDITKPWYSAAYQTVNVNYQGAVAGEYDSLPEGSPNPDNFDGCIFICDPASAGLVSEYSGMRIIGGTWYIYYGDGCYGMYSRDSENFVSVEENCCNPDHDHGHPNSYKVTADITSYLNSADGVVVDLLKGDEIIGSKTVFGNSASAEFLDVPSGEYVLRVGKTNHVTRETAVSITDKDVETSIKICPLGDVNSDGKTTNYDYAWAVAYCRKKRTLDEYQIKCGDVFGSGDGYLKMTDAARIIQHIRKEKKLYE